MGAVIGILQACIMNYLAHFYLGFGDDDTVAGQFLADSYKGSKYRGLPPAIARGVLLHRFIDHTTDTDPGLAGLRLLLRQEAGKWAGPALDVLCDHMLSHRWATHTDAGDRAAFISDTYALLLRYRDMCNAPNQQRLDAMRHHDWLSMYHSAAGMRQIFAAMARRLPAAGGLNRVMDVYEHYEIQFLTIFDTFFPALVSSCQEKYESM